MNRYSHVALHATSSCPHPETRTGSASDSRTPSEPAAGLSPARHYSQASPEAASAAAFACSPVHAAYCSAVSIVTKPFMR